jgi:bifunctional non-homologous end joining protein LigD
MGDPLSRYKEKRNFSVTPEPAEGSATKAGQLQFVIQKHWATRLHYDLRLEINGSMKSWAVPKGPSLDPADKRMAVEVEDHPMSYNDFEGQIPAKQYGAGRVIIWDRGTWVPEGDAARGWRQGRLKFELHGHKLQGHWALVRIKAKNSSKPTWLLIKEHDAYERAAADYNVVEAEPDSVAQLPVTRTRQPSTAPKAVVASRMKIPAALAPQLATLVSTPPPDAADWLYELKFDGYRILSRVVDGKVAMFTRNGHDWTDRMPQLAEALQALPLRGGWLDGEVVSVNSEGVPDFQQLQNAFEGAGTQKLIYYVFDLPFADGLDLRKLALSERRKKLQALLAQCPSDHIRFSEAFDKRPEDLVASACQIGFEGVIGKRQDAPYASGRSAHWIKLKCGQRQEFVVGGYTDPKGSRQGLGALLLGVYNAEGALRYAGSVGSGFTEKSLSELTAQLKPLASRKCPFAADDDLPAKAHWVRPQLVAEVAFAQWTDGHRIRHSVFKGLRTDKPARHITREKPTESPAPQPQRGQKGQETPAATALQITHGDRVIDPSTGLTKRDLAAFYAKVAPLMLEHLHHRPVALVRAPSGVDGAQFFQKHQEGAALPGIKPLAPALDEGHAPLLEVVSLEGLLSGAQMNVVEYHTWNARKDKIERPDRMTFDLDPGEGVPWQSVQEGAHLVRVLLQEMALPRFLKTSGGKGLHVVVPIKRLHAWGSVKAFSQLIVQHLSETIPERFVAKSGPRNRVGKIYVDYLRNGRGATTVCAWSARARAGMGVSVPVGWDELDGLSSAAHWNVRNIEQRLRTGNAPWVDYSGAAVSLTSAMKLLGFKPSREG